MLIFYSKINTSKIYILLEKLTNKSLSENTHLLICKYPYVAACVFAAVNPNNQEQTQTFKSCILFTSKYVNTFYWGFRYAIELLIKQ